MIRIGLTGSIGMGKSAVAAMFKAEGVPVFDADAAVRQLQGRGGILVDAIEDRFPGTTGPKGVDRQKLGGLVFGKPEELIALERIVHPAVSRFRQRFLQKHRSHAVVLLDIPLLFEKGGAKQADVVVVVSAPGWVQRRRVLARAGMTALKFKRINALQVPDVIKRGRADYVIKTGCLRHQTRQSVRHLIACLRARKSG